MKMKCKITLDRVNTSEPPEVLVAQGYRCVSRAYCMVARIDRPDWLEVMAKRVGCAVADFYRKDGGGVSAMWADTYRREHSKDVLTVHPDIVRMIPTSGWDPVGYIPKAVNNG